MTGRPSLNALRALEQSSGFVDRRAATGCECSSGRAALLPPACRSCDNDERERDDRQCQGALFEAAKFGTHDREPGDDEGEGDPGDDRVGPAQRDCRGRHESRNQSKDDPVLVEVDEDDRSHEGDREPADQPAGPDQEVEAGRVGGRRARAPWQQSAARAKANR